MMADQSHQKVTPIDSDPTPKIGQSGLGAVESQIKSLRPEQQQVDNKKWRDLPFVILFLLDVAVVVAFMLIWGIKLLTNHDAVDTSSSSVGVVSSADTVRCVGICLVMAVLAIAIALAINHLTIQNAACVITFMLWFNVGITMCVAGAGFAMGNLVLGLLGSLISMASLCYARSVASRIPFAAANLKVAGAAISRFFACYLVAFGVACLQMLWIIVWSIALLGVFNATKKKDTTLSTATKEINALCDANAECKSNLCSISKNNHQKHCMATLPFGGAAAVLHVFMLLSLYWAIQVLKNISHTTIAGAVATWWYRAEPQTATIAALKRSCTTSLGSICLGSLLVAIVQTLHALSKNSNRNNGNNAAACLAQCFLSCLESFLKYINRWAFVYVGIYGYKFTDAGRAVMQLFQQRGFEAIINDDLIGDVLSFAAMTTGLVCALIGVIAAKVLIRSMSNASLVLGLVGFVIGVGVSFAPLSVIDSAVATVFVCFAEDPASLMQSHPDHYAGLINAWYTMYPSIMAQGGYPRV